MTTFKDALSLCGLSLQEAAEYLGLSKSMVDSMASGRREVSDNTWRSLSDLWQTINEASSNTKNSLHGITDKDIAQRIILSNAAIVVGYDGIPVSAKGIAATKAFLEVIADTPLDDAPQSKDEVILGRRRSRRRRFRCQIPAYRNGARRQRR
ncbi:helix-turn-helix domain-containing protein [Sinorhizobium fredii]|uniref:helix-turn-helix domain-containing protein n=1 Tax=Rhizobium fredii TaxID=380 RepID=UPI0012FE4E0E|nr:helix-turn-helix transcriptional regulator [Sinorhizobium fredii]